MESLHHVEIDTLSWVDQPAALIGRPRGGMPGRWTDEWVAGGYSMVTSRVVRTPQVIEPVAEALGGAGGDVLGGVWFLLVSLVALRSRVFPRALNWLGLGVGAAALLSAVPGLIGLEVVAGVLQIVWFLWFGITTARIGSTEPQLIG